MKTALLTDTHFGANNDSSVFLDYHIAFIQQRFIPRLKAEGVERIIIPGDFLDRRKYVNFNTLYRIRTEVLEPLNDVGLPIDISAGNHDVYWLNTNRVSSLLELIGTRYPNIKVWTEPGLIDIGHEHPATLLPWINSGNTEICNRAIASAPEGSICFGHLELNGFEAVRGIPFSSPHEPKPFQRFSAVFSGHFHIKQSKMIGDTAFEYLGTPYDLTVTDRSETKFWHIFDADAGSLKAIKNPDKLFYQILYDDSVPIDDLLSDANAERYKGKILRLIVEHRSDPVLFDSICDHLTGVGSSLTVVEPSKAADDVEGADISKSTIDLICEAAEALPGGHDKNRLKNLVHGLYLTTLAGA